MSFATGSTTYLVKNLFFFFFHKLFKITNMRISGPSDHYNNVYEFYVTWVPNTALTERI